MQGLDGLLGVAAVANGPAYDRDTALQRRIRDKLIGPQMVEQVLAGDSPITVLDEVGQSLERLRFEFHWLASTA
jgi:hypothetical protein